MIYMGVLRIVVYTYTRYRYEGLLGVLPFCLQQAAPRSQPKSVLMFESSNESCCCARCARETNKCLSTIKYNNHHNIHEMPATRYILSPQRIYLLCCACCVRSSWRLKHRGLDTQRKRTHSAHSSSTRSLHTPALLTQSEFAQIVALCLHQSIQASRHSIRGCQGGKESKTQQYNSKNKERHHLKYGERRH